MFADFHFYYHVDVREMLRDPYTPPRLILAMIDRLPQGSMTQSLLAGGEEGWRYYLDFGREVAAIAGVYDAINENTASTGFFKKRPQFDPFPTPSELVKRDRKREVPKDLDGLHAMFSKMLVDGEG